MTSRQIIVELIDQGKITGEQAVILINDIVVAEMCEAQKVLDQCKPKVPDYSELTSNLRWISPTSTYTTTGYCDSSTGTNSAIGTIVANSI